MSNLCLISILAAISFSCSLSQSKDYNKERDNFNLEKGILYYKEKPFTGKILYNNTSEESFKEGILFGAYKDFYGDGTLKEEGIYSEVEFEIRKKPATRLPPPPPPPPGYVPDDTPFNYNQPVPMILLDSPPVFPGCVAMSKDELENCLYVKFADYFRKNFRYPFIARVNGIEDIIYCRYTISTDGEIINIRCEGEKENSFFLAQEAGRLISKLPKFKPAEKDGIQVSTMINQPITFRLRK